eukprot:14005662-Alexandrium_andersonii.AAC.1
MGALPHRAAPGQVPTRRLAKRRRSVHGAEPTPAGATRTKTRVAEPRRSSSLTKAGGGTPGRQREGYPGSAPTSLRVNGYRQATKRCRAKAPTTGATTGSGRSLPAI